MMKHPGFYIQTNMADTFGISVSDKHFELMTLEINGYTIDVDNEFNPGTGLFEGIDKYYNEIHIIINEPYIAESSIERTKNKIEDYLSMGLEPPTAEEAEKIRDDIYEKLFVSTIFEETWHSVNDVKNHDYFKVRYNEESRKYILTDEYIEYSDRKFEIKAKEMAAEGLRQYNENENTIAIPKKE